MRRPALLHAPLLVLAVWLLGWNTASAARRRRYRPAAPAAAPPPPPPPPPPYRRDATRRGTPADMKVPDKQQLNDMRQACSTMANVKWNEKARLCECLPGFIVGNSGCVSPSDLDLPCSPASIAALEKGVAAFNDGP